MADEVKLQLEMHRNLPSKQSDSTFGYAQSDGYGAQRVAQMRAELFADEGTLFHACNATPGTGLAGHAAPTDITSVLKPLIHIKNASGASERKRLYLKWIKLTVTAAGTGGTAVSFAEEIDDAARYTSGGTQLTPKSPNMDTSNPSAADVLIYAGAVVAPAAGTNARKLGSALMRSVIPVVGDTYTFIYGSDVLVPPSMIVAGTAIANLVFQRPPVVLGPGQTFLHHQAQPSQSAASSFEIEICGVLR